MYDLKETKKACKKQKKKTKNFNDSKSNFFMQ